MGFGQLLEVDPDLDIRFDNYENINESYTEKSICEMLEAKGVKKYKGIGRPDSKKSSNYNTYWFGRGYGDKQEVGCYVLGEKNLFGARPLYRYDFYINEDTDIVESVSVALERFVNE